MVNDRYIHTAKGCLSSQPACISFVILAKILEEWGGGSDSHHKTFLLLILLLPRVCIYVSRRERDFTRVSCCCAPHNLQKNKQHDEETSAHGE